MLQIGDRFKFKAGTVIRGESLQIDDKDARAFVRKNPGYQYKSYGAVQKFWTASDNEYVVIDARADGATTNAGGMSRNDSYPNGHFIIAVPVGTPLTDLGANRVSFYQTGCFADQVMADVIITGRATGPGNAPLTAGRK
jgi:hypothetical protein